MQKDELIKNIHSIFREDSWIRELFTSIGLTLDELNNAIIDLEKQYWFDTMTWAIPINEKLLAIKFNPTNSIEDRRSFIEAKWKSAGKADLALIQAVCNSWKNGKVAASFRNGKIELKFNGEYGIPNDFQGLLKILDDVKPSHLGLNYIFTYLLVKDINNKITLNELQSRKIHEFAFKI